MKGELYEVDDIVLQDLDILEDHPSYYVREQKQFQPLDNKSETLTAWVYFIKNFKPELLKERTLESYSDNNPYGLKYTARYLRKENDDYRTQVFNN